ncbi:hypothetical protein B0H19DRAFT_25714 [Mycena capillaripes]|nr:hypothetical protein B0H19DRAFT_25714 [Mycena capillaripes]
MCPGDNSAKLSARYLNAQLSAMYENAAECVGSEGKKTSVDFRSDDYEMHKYTRSLAQFHFAGIKSPREPIGKEKLFFDGNFGKPRLEFICNHEAALYLKLEKGHFNNVYPTKVNGYKNNQKDNVTFNGLDIAFRLKFSRTSLSGKDSRIGNGAGLLIQLMVLDFSSAQMVSLKPELPNGTKDSLEWYLRKYLAFLQKAGHHVRFDLPDFDADQHKPYINYSLVTRALQQEELCANVTVHGIGEWQINDFLRETWLDVVSKAQGFCGERPTDKLSSCMTEIQSTWVGNLNRHFHIRFSPPRVKALCKHEVVLYFTAAEVDFYDSEDFSRKPIHSFVDWDFAFIVDVVEEKVGDALSLKLDFTTARFSQHLSTALVQEVRIHFTYIRTFFESHYLDFLARYHMHIYYPGGYRGDDAPEFSEVSDYESEWKVGRSDGGKSSGAIVWSETIKKIVLYGFDRIIAVSEESINSLFSALYKAADKSRGCLAEWRHKENFLAHFSTIRVKLLSSGKALVTFKVEDGHFMLKDKRRKYEFSAWTISYEVDIKMIDQSKLCCEEGWFHRFSDSVRSVFGMHEHEAEAHTTVKHIVLDFANAKYVYKHSSMPGMWDGGSLSAVDRLESFIHYMRKYLSHLSSEGHSIIHSTPIFPLTHQFGLTAASFQVVSQTTVTVSNCMFQQEPPVIMVVGMTCGRPLPAQHIHWGSGWVVPGKSHGTICLSSASFLESKLLTTLELVNRRTTVVPRFPLEHEEEWKVYLTTWDRHQHRKDKKCHWSKVEKSNSSWLEYGWEHRDEWSYEHEGTHKASGFSVLCHTKNQLCIPTTYRPQATEIILRGESVLRLKSQNDKER